MDEVLDAFRDAFAPKPGVSAWMLILLCAVLGLAVVAWGRAVMRRRRNDKQRLHDFVRERSLTTDDVDLLKSIAAKTRQPPLAITKRIDLFERASAHILATHASEGAAVRLASVRHKLGFDSIPASSPILTSRELAAGTRVEIASTGGTVVDVSDEALVIEVDQPVAVFPGSEVVAVVPHGPEALYELSFTVVGTQAKGAHGRLVLSHCEAPVRVQRRDTIRVNASADVELAPVQNPRPLGPRRGNSPGARPEVDAKPVHARLLNIGAGGLLAEATEPFLQHTSVRLSFHLPKLAVRGLLANVVASEPTVGGKYALRIEFNDAFETDRIGLVARLMQATTRSPPTEQIRSGRRAE